MITDERSVESFTEIASNLFVSMIIDEYGAESVNDLFRLTRAIKNIYKNLPYHQFTKVDICVSLNSKMQLEEISSIRPETLTSYENLASVEGSSVIVEVLQTGDLQILIDSNIDILSIREESLIYEFTYNGTVSIEKMYGKKSERKLPSIPNTDSYFAIQTYKELDTALEDYGKKVARFSDCPDLRSLWVDDNKLFVLPKPEHKMRDSLTDFLKNRLRNAEVRPEQIVDKSHPVDIKVTWSGSNSLAIIEIKWLGKSLAKVGSRFKQIYTHGRALEGAKQLADYLDANKIQAPLKTTIGYLAVFDVRRYGCNKNSTVVTIKNGMKYANEGINFNPDYNIQRKDFAKPVRFFMEPANMT